MAASEVGLVVAGSRLSRSRRRAGSRRASAEACGGHRERAVMLGETRIRSARGWRSRRAGHERWTAYPLGPHLQNRLHARALGFAVPEQPPTRQTRSRVHRARGRSSAPSAGRHSGLRLGAWEVSMGACGKSRRGGPGDPGRGRRLGSVEIRGRRSRAWRATMKSPPVSGPRPAAALPWGGGRSGKGPRTGQRAGHPSPIPEQAPALRDWPGASRTWRTLGPAMLSAGSR